MHSASSDGLKGFQKKSTCTPTLMVLALISVLLLTLSSQARADGLSSWASVCSSKDWANSCGIQSGDGITSASSTLTAPSYVGLATASAAYGTLGAYAAVSVTDYSPYTFAEAGVGFWPAARTGASFEDTWSVTGASSGFVNVTFEINGSVLSDPVFCEGCPPSYVVTNGTGIDQGVMFGVIYGQEYPYQTWNYESFITGNTTVPIQIPFSGSPFLVNFGMGAVIYINDVGTENYSYSGVVDFAHTAKLTSIEITDADGKPISGAAITSSNWQSYGLSSIQEPGPSTVPEPSTLVLLGTALLGLGCTTKRKIGS